MLVALPFVSFSLLCLLFGRRAVFGEKNALLLFFFIVLPVFFLGLFYIGFRPFDAGIDTPVYIRAYQSLQGVLTAREVGVAQYGNTELLWWPMQSLVRPFLGAREWLILNYLVSFSATFLAYRVICKNYAISPWLFALVFLSYYFVYAGNTIRQATSIPFGVMAFFLFFDRRVFLAMFLAFLAIGLHWSAIFFLLAPAMTLPMFRSRATLMALPLAALVLSVFFIDLAGWGVSLLGVPELQAKYDLYFSGVRDSHVGPVWKTFNFWVCTVVPFLFLWLCRQSRYECRHMHAYVFLLLVLILAGINVSDFSERFFPAMLFVLPVLVALILMEFRLPAIVSNILFLFGFFFLGFMVFISGSAQETLGYNAENIF